jgi:hypothetical protein
MTNDKVQILNIHKIVREVFHQLKRDSLPIIWMPKNCHSKLVSESIKSIYPEGS